MSEALNRRALLKAAAAATAAGVLAPRMALGHETVPYGERLAGPLEDTLFPGLGFLPEGGLAAVSPGQTVITKHDRGDAIITRYQANLDSGDFGVAPDLRTGLIYVSQRVGNNIAVFSRKQGKFIAKLPLPTEGSGPHNIVLDARTNSVWIAAGESSRIIRLVLDRKKLLPKRFVEYVAPGAERVAKPHSLAVVDGRQVWYTDDRQERVGFLNARTGKIRLLDEHIEADGIMLEERFTRPGGRRPMRRLWIAGGSHVTIIDVRTRRVTHSIPIEFEPGISQLRLHDLGLVRDMNRVYCLSRGGDRVFWMKPRRPKKGPRATIRPTAEAAGLDHMSVGRRYIWWTEGISNTLARHDPRTGRTKGYEVPVPAGYFNPHGVKVVPKWREVWFTERESICVLRFKDGRQP